MVVSPDLAASLACTLLLMILYLAGKEALMDLAVAARAMIHKCLPVRAGTPSVLVVALALEVLEEEETRLAEVEVALSNMGRACTTKDVGKEQ